MMKVAVVKGKGKAFEAACNNWFLEHKKAEIHKVSFALIDNAVPVAFILYNEQERGKREVFADESLAPSPGSWLEYLIQAQQKQTKSVPCEDEKEEASDGSAEDDEWPW